MLRKFFRHTPLGRTLSLRNKTGKTVLTLVGSVLGVKTSVEATDIEMGLEFLQFLTDFTFSDIILFCLTLIIGALVQQGWITKKVADEIDQLVRVYVAAKHKDSESGVGLSPTEKEAILAELSDVIEELMNSYGIQIDLDGDGK